MFNEFSPIKKSLFKERVNPFLGMVFLGTCTLWALMVIWNFASGNTPIDIAIAHAIEKAYEE